METAISALSILPSTKEQKDTFVFMAVTEIMNYAGGEKILTYAAKLKFWIDTLTEIYENGRIKASVKDEAFKNPEKILNVENYAITKSQRTAYDYKGIDPVLDSLYGQMEQLKQAIKAREATVKSGFDPATGETFAPVPFTQTDILSYKLK